VSKEKLFSSKSISYVVVVVFSLSPLSSKKNVNKFGGGRRGKKKGEDRHHYLTLIEIIL